MLITTDAINLPDISIAFDTMVRDTENSTWIGSKITAISDFGKNTANKRALIGKMCYRMCSKEEFEKRRTHDLPEYRRVGVTKTVFGVN